MRATADMNREPKAATAIRHLKELLAALARRVPQGHRQDEAAIARDSAVLSEQARARLKTLEDGEGPAL